MMKNCRISSVFSLSLFFYVVVACTSSDDIQLSYSQQTNTESSHTDSGQGAEPASQPDEPSFEPSAQPSSQEDTGAESENGLDWDTIPDSLVSLNDGVHRVGWQNHDVYVSVPATYVGDGVLPLVVILHDGLGCPSSDPAQELAVELLGQIPAVVLYPQSTSCTWSQNGTADTEFVQGVITDWSAHDQIDESRVSLMGMDQGGQVAINTQISELVGLGVLLTSAQEGWTIPSSSTQHSFVQLVNKRDDQVPFSGGNGLQSVPDSVLQWVEHNDCSYAPDISSIGVVSIQEYPDCVSGSRVVLASVLPEPWHEECQSSWQQAQQSGTEMISPEGIDCGKTHELPTTAFSQSSWKFVWGFFSQ